MRRRMRPARATALLVDRSGQACSRELESPSGATSANSLGAAKLACFRQTPRRQMVADEAGQRVMLTESGGGPSLDACHFYMCRLHIA